MIKISQMIHKDDKWYINSTFRPPITYNAQNTNKKIVPIGPSGLFFCAAY